MSDADAEARAIAARLTQAQRRAIMWLPAATDMARICPLRLEASLRAMAPFASGRCAGLTQSLHAGAWWRLTPLGQRVRAIVARDAG